MTRRAIGDRLAARFSALAVAALLTVLLMAGGAGLLPAMVGLAAVTAWAVLVPAAAARITVPGRGAEGPASPAAMAAPVAAAVPIWRILVDGIPDAAVVLEGDTVVRHANRPAREALSVRPGLQLAHSIRDPGLLAAVDRALQEDRPQAVEMSTPMPHERTLAALVTPLRPRTASDDEDHPALLIVLRDKTEEQQLAQMRADFVANASHELRTPLASLKGFIETLQGAARDDPAARERFLAIMQEQAGRMARLIEDLLSLSRVEMREHVLPDETVDLAEIVETVTRALQPIAETAQQTLAATLAMHPALVRGDRDELAQVVQNLVQNAIKYGKDGGSITVSLARDGARLALAVTDDGIGIAPEHLPRLTERFYRVSAKESRDRGGTGLGLAIVKHIVNRHRGDLRITSEPGKGSRFTILLDPATVPATG